MDTELKISKSRAIVISLLIVVAMTLIGFFLYDAFIYPIGFRQNDIYRVILQAALLLVLSVFILYKIYMHRFKPLTFNNVTFTYKGKTYRYIRIEKVVTTGNTLMGSVYTIIVDGKRLYSFDNEYIGANEFLYYLNAYNVPGTPRG